MNGRADTSLYHILTTLVFCFVTFSAWAQQSNNVPTVSTDPNRLSSARSAFGLSKDIFRDLDAPTSRNSLSSTSTRSASPHSSIQKATSRIISAYGTADDVASILQILADIATIRNDILIDPAHGRFVPDLGAYPGMPILENHTCSFGNIHLNASVAPLDDCDKCFDIQYSRLSKLREIFENNKIVYIYTKYLQTQGVSIADRAGSLPYAKFITKDWENQINESTQKIVALYDRHYGEALDKLVEILREIDSCEESHFGYKGWYGEYGASFHAFFMLRYARATIDAN